MMALDVAGMLLKGYSRHGSKLHLPNIFEKWFPSTIFVDCELWFGRGQFASTYGLIGLTDTSSDVYHSLVFLRTIAFDIPTSDFQNFPIEDRFHFLLASVNSKDNLFVIIPPRFLCEGSRHLSLSVQNIIDEEGEGVILQLRGSLYEPGRTSTLIKMKAVQGDAEAIVVCVGEDKSVSLQLPNGLIFSVAPTDVHIPTPVAGDVVTFSYERHARRDLPVGPKVLRLRTDMSWNDVLQNSKLQKLNESSYVKGFVTRPLGHWTTKTMRTFLETFAKHRNLDPLVPTTWYNAYPAFKRTKGGKAILRKFKGGYLTALRSLLHEVRFNKIDFWKSNWRSVEDRRQFFESYAQRGGFDWRIPENWYQQSKERIMAFKGAKGLVSYYNNSISKALVDLFPDIGLNLEKLEIEQGRSDIDNRRQFFENYSRRHQFDHLNPENWYKQSIEEIMSSKGASDLALYYNGGIIVALVKLFPDIGLDVSRFPSLDRSSDIRKRREFFENYAKENGFNPHNPEHWYSQPQETLFNAKGASGVILHHKRSVVQALLDLFPDIGLEESKFRTKQSWKSENSRRDFFTSYAEAHQFNYRNPEQWYLQSKDKICSTKGARGVLAYHDQNVVSALVDLFPDIKFDKSKFSGSYSPLREISYRRKLFEEYAVSKGFEVSSPTCWYAQPREEMLAWKGIKAAIRYHSGRISTALVELFPNIGLDETKFDNIKPLWVSVASRRKFFEEYAKNNTFDHLDPHAWYTKAKEVMTIKGVGRVLNHHRGTVVQALIDLFPDITFDKAKFLR